MTSAHGVRCGLRPGLARTLLVVLVAALIAAATPRVAHAQACEPVWLPGEAGQDLVGTVNALRSFDPDGAGPLPSWLIAAGRLLRTRTGTDAMVVAFDGTSWRNISPEPSFPLREVLAMTVYNNQLIVAGTFTSIAGMPAARIAAWNGTSWSALGTGLSGTVSALEVFNGSLYAGGQFATAGGVASPNLARWNGTTWSAAVSGMTPANASVLTLRTFSGRLYAGGTFSSISGVAASNLAVLNAGAWFAFGNPNGPVNDIEPYNASTLPGRLYIGGNFSLVDGLAVDRVAWWNASNNAWSGLGPWPVQGLGVQVKDLFVRNVGLTGLQLISTDRDRVYVYGASGWELFEPDYGIRGIDGCNSITYSNGQYYVGRTGVPSDSAVKVLQTSGSWDAFGTGTPGQIRAMRVLPSGELLSSISATANEGVARIVRRAPGASAWTHVPGEFYLSAGVLDPRERIIRTLDVLPNGNLLVTGTFGSVSGSSLSGGIAIWDGSDWTGLGATLTGGVVKDAVVTPDGDVIVAGTFTSSPTALGVRGIARWTGSNWASLGGGIPNGSATALRLLPNGDLLVGGHFTTIGTANVATNNLARWNGTTWSAETFGFPLEPAQDIVALAMDASGAMAAIVNDQTWSRVMSWNGSIWNSVGSVLNSGGPDRIVDVEFGDAGDLIVCGQFTCINGGVAAASIARWHMGAWQRIGSIGLTTSGEPPTFETSVTVHALDRDPAGRLVAGGAFRYADTDVSVGIATLDVSPPCGGCDTIDFNADGLFPDDQDLIDFLSVFAGGPCSTGTCNDIDFNNDDLFPDDADLAAFLNVLAGGAC